MAWLLGAVGLYHIHPAPLHGSRPPSSQHVRARGAQTLVVAAGNDDCPICDWKMRTPYTASPLVVVPVSVEPCLACPVAPVASMPEGWHGHYRNRAPPGIFS